MGQHRPEAGQRDQEGAGRDERRGGQARPPAAAADPGSDQHRRAEDHAAHDDLLSRVQEAEHDGRGRERHQRGRHRARRRGGDQGERGGERQQPDDEVEMAVAEPPGEHRRERAEPDGAEPLEPRQPARVTAPRGRHVCRRPAGQGAEQRLHGEGRHHGDRDRREPQGGQQWDERERAEDVAALEPAQQVGPEDERRPPVAAGHLANHQQVVGERVVAGEGARPRPAEQERPRERDDEDDERQRRDVVDLSPEAGHASTHTTPRARAASIRRLLALVGIDRAFARALCSRRCGWSRVAGSRSCRTADSRGARRTRAPGS